MKLYFDTFCVEIGTFKKKKRAKWYQRKWKIPIWRGYSKRRKSKSGNIKNVEYERKGRMNIFVNYYVKCFEVRKMEEEEIVWMFWIVVK